MKLMYITWLTLLLFWSCKETVEAEKGFEILSFSVEHQIGTAIINIDNATVYAEVDTTTDLSALVPSIELSKKASIQPASGVETDFSNGPIDYEVIAENKEIKHWSVSVAKQKSVEAKILSFTVKRQNGETIINDTNISAEVRLGTNLATIKPDIVVSAKAQVSPASGEEVDFSAGPVIYTVTAESGLQQMWLVELKGEKIYEANILTYAVPEQIGESLFDGSSIYCEVPVGYDLTHVVPTLSTTEGTTVSPASGEAVNFAAKGYVDYSVTTAINTKKNWRVYVSEEMVKANNPNIQYMGRVDFENPLKPRLYAAGTCVKVKFKGTFCQILLNDQNLYSSYNNYLQIVIDDSEFIRYQTSGKNNVIDIVKNLSDGEHTLSITKATEAGIGYIELVGFRCDEVLAPDPVPERRIEFIGNSITCGYGVDDSEVACGGGEWYDQHNAYFAYGPLVSRSFNAQCMLTSVSGIGLIHSCCDMTYTMPDVYQTVDLKKGGIAWDFNKYQADVVTICLGQNDGIQDSATFCAAYVAFIKTIQSKYSHADIVCLTSPMADNSLKNAQMNYINGILQHLNDDRIHKLFLSNSFNSGCDAHPNRSEHQETANEIITFLKVTLGW